MLLLASGEWMEWFNYPGLELWKFLNLAIFTAAGIFILRKPISQALQSRRDAIKQELVTAQQERERALARVAEADNMLNRLHEDERAVRQQAEEEAKAERERLAAATTRDGFTGHEMLDNVALIHMNGRIYDPAIGRFLSADPFVTSPYDSQGFNRYTYVNNNPLSLADPSGFSAADGDRPPLLCDDGCLAWFFADFTYGYVPFNPYFGPFPPVTEPRSTPVPPQPPFAGPRRSSAPDLSAFSGLAADSHVAGGSVCARAGLCAGGAFQRVTFDNFVDFVAGVGDVMLATVSLGITDAAEYRRVMDVGSVDLNSKAYQAGFWGTIFASAGLARALVKPPSPPPPVGATGVVGELAETTA